MYDASSRPSSEKLESEIKLLGREIYDDVQSSSLSLFDTRYYSGKLMDWAMQDRDFKVSLFRFVDVLPSLNRSAAIIEHAQEYFGPQRSKLPAPLAWGLSLSPHSITAGISAQLIKSQIKSVAEGFIVGESAKKGLKALRKIRQAGMAFTVDILGEATLNQAESQVYLERYLDLLVTLAREVPAWPEAKPVVAGHRGERTPLNISVKLSALYSQIRPVATEHSVAVLVERLLPILEKAREVNAFVYLDMEDSSMVSITIETLKRALSLPAFRDLSNCGIVLQAYLRRTQSDLDDLIQWVRQRGTPIGVRLVKGAYWDTETIHALQHGWPIPVWQEKSKSDETYERLSLTLLQNAELIEPAFGSHNIRSLVHAIKAAEQLGVQPTEFELQALFGMAEPIKAAFVRRGYLVREYAPIGDLIPGMSYLVRRLLENTSNEGFLRQSFREHEKIETLLERPTPTSEDTGEEHLQGAAREAFQNTALLDFTLDHERSRFAEALNDVFNQIEQEPFIVRPQIRGSEITASQSISSVTPEDPRRILARVYLADRKQTEEAIESLASFSATWKRSTPQARAEILFRAAEIMLERRYELGAIICLESGKPWIEADADVAEAVDFLNYYAHQALALFEKRTLGSYPGEANRYWYEPRGVTAVIGPWNFPLAIPCGMFSAALVTGNCAILKPAEQSSLIASELFHIMLEAGLPEEAACFLPGLGEEIGPLIVEHPKVASVVFTGSKEVGLQIIRSAADTRPGFVHVKRVIAEMGGKNAIIVDEDADLDEAVKGVLYSAFGFQGQKCSACSRAIILDAAYDRFVDRLAEAVKTIDVGPSSRPETYVGPVIDKQSHARILQIIAKAKQDCTLVAEGRAPLEKYAHGYFIRPTIFADIPGGHSLLYEEVFGPVLALVRVKTFDEALQVALDSEYALTGALFSRSPKNIERALADFAVGNLYINRGSTGALVMRQPFGGARMSGVGSKAGGPDYLHQFVNPRAVSENTMRRGFAPEL